MNITECTADNPRYTSRYDAAIRKIRKELGSYDNIAMQVHSHTAGGLDLNFCGASYRRWFLRRYLPIHVACVIVDLMKGKLDLTELFPYLDNYVGVEEDEDDFE